MKLIVYSHDTYGLGNIRRMLAICHYLLQSIPDLSILFISGSPMLHSFRIPQGFDYVKLPCVTRDEEGKISTKYLDTTIKETIKIRSDILYSTIFNFKPDIILVDKKVYGVKCELQDTIRKLKRYLPNTKLVLLLRDILDASESTIKNWHEEKAYEAIELFYDLVLVVGTEKIFNLIKEYNISSFIANKVRYCGYIRRESGRKSRSTIRKELQLLPEDKLVLVTAGGGEDGSRLINTYIAGLDYLPIGHRVKSLIICGSEMPPNVRQIVYEAAAKRHSVQLCDFTDDLMSYIDAADIVVSMSGYNTICEILSLKKKAVIVPRIKPSQEQWIRADRMSKFGLFRTIHPNNLTGQRLMLAVLTELNRQQNYFLYSSQIDLGALPRIQQYISKLVLVNKTVERGSEASGVSCKHLLRETHIKRLKCLKFGEKKY